MLRARIVSDDVSGLLRFEYAVPFAPGLIEILCLNLPDSVKLLGDELLAGWDVEQLRSIGRRNLRLEKLQQPQRVGDRLVIIEAESFFVASQLLDPEFHARALGEAPLGFVAAIPDRHTLILHTLLGADSLGPINQLAGFMSATDQDHRPGGFLSPHVYYVSVDGVEQITDYNPDGEMIIRAEGAFLEAINRDDP